ncbi:MAG: DUF4054 domain-containing protein [Coriobacteriia bacterium]
MPFPQNIVPNTYPTGQDISVLQVVGNASNIRTGVNPPYILADFTSYYPGFAASGVPPTQPVPDEILQVFINLANASLFEARYHELWKVCMGFFVAHFATLWLEGTVATGSSAAKVVAAGKAKGLLTSKSVGDVSASIDYNSVVQDLDGWAAWKLTIYGQQLATFAKLVSRGGMMAW